MGRFVCVCCCRYNEEENAEQKILEWLQSLRSVRPSSYLRDVPLASFILRAVRHRIGGLCGHGYTKGRTQTQSSVATKSILLLLLELYECSWHQPPFSPVAGAATGQGYFPLFLCHGDGRASERNTNNSCDLHWALEWISKVYADRIAADRFSSGQARLDFLQAEKGKLYQASWTWPLFIPPPVRSYCQKMRHLSPTCPVGKQLCHPEQREYFRCVRDTRVCLWLILHLPISSPSTPTLPQRWSSLPYHFSMRSHCESKFCQNPCGLCIGLF